MPSCGRYRRSSHHHSRAGDNAVFDGLLEREDHFVPGAEVAHRRDAGAYGCSHGLNSAHQEGFVRFSGDMSVRVFLSRAVDVRVHLNEARHDCPVINGNYLGFFVLAYVEFVLGGDL